MERDDTVIDAALSALHGDGPKARDILFKIKTGEIKHGNAKGLLAAARYEDWKETK